MIPFAPSVWFCWQYGSGSMVLAVWFWQYGSEQMYAHPVIEIGGGAREHQAYRSARYAHPTSQHSRETNKPANSSHQITRSFPVSTANCGNRARHREHRPGPRRSRPHGHAGPPRSASPTFDQSLAAVVSDVASERLTSQGRLLTRNRCVQVPKHKFITAR